MRWRRVIIVVALFVAGLLAALLYARRAPANAVRKTPAGEFELLGVTVAGQNFKEGSTFQRLFERFIPRSGIRLGGLKLRRPVQHRDRKDAPMNVWLLYRGTGIARRPNPPLFGGRVVVVDSAGTQYENGVPMIERLTPGDQLIRLPITEFPSNEKEFVLRFSPPPGPPLGTRVWVEFTVANPLFQVLRTWPGLPLTNVVNHQEIVLAEVNLFPAICNLYVPPPSTWSIESCMLADAGGNLYIPNGMRSGSKGTNGATYQFRFNHVLDTNQTWSVNLKLATAHLYLAASPEESRTMRLVSGGNPQPLTNSAGEAFSASFDGNALLMEGPAAGSNAPAHGWIVLGATNADSGERVQIPPYARERQVSGKPPVRVWTLLSRGTVSELEVQVAWPKTSRTEFHLSSGTAKP